MSKTIAFHPIFSSENRGLGNALKTALDRCTNRLVARMDSDDISMPYRFQVQLDKFRKDGSLDIVGGPITEFVSDPSNITGERAVKMTDVGIKADMKKRCAMNHVTVMYKKDSVQAAGGYQDWHYNEDYYLWIRMMEKGCYFANVPYPLVNVRTGMDMSARRGGWEYFKSERELQHYMLAHKIISYPQYLYNVAVRFGGELLAPNPVRRLIYRAIRKGVEAGTLPDAGIICKECAGKDYPPFSVATSVYRNDNPGWFDMALEN